MSVGTLTTVADNGGRQEMAAERDALWDST